MMLEGRHQSTVQIAKHFTYGHLPPELRAVSKECHDLADEMIQTLADGPELTTGLRKLLEAKDCFVRQAITDRDARADDVEAARP